MEILAIFCAGAVGALISDIIQDNCLILPEFKDQKLYLGSLGGILVGGIAGYLIDGSIVTAFMGGFVGKSIIISLLKTYEQRLQPQIAEQQTEIQQ